MKHKQPSSGLWQHFWCVGRTFLGISASAWLAATAVAHNLDQRDTSIVYDDAYVSQMVTRAGFGQPLIQTNDEMWLVFKSTPGPGTLTGVGGYLTFYIPTGRVEVLEAAYLTPVPGAPSGSHSPANFAAIPVKGQSIIAIGSGPIGPASTSALIGLKLTNSFGQAEDVVTGAGVHRGTIAGVYADTGIFFSEDPRTSWQSWSNAPASGPLSRRGYPVSMVNNRGETIVPITRYDAEQLIAYGRSDVAPVVDPNGRGNTPWGLGNVVSGPQSGYSWQFDLNTWLDTANMKNSVSGVGPWQRVKYAGSQYAKDQAGLISSTLGYAGEGAASAGYALGNDPGESSLPSAANAVRFSYGMLELGRPEYAAIKIRIKSLPSADCFSMFTDAFGGDAGGEQGGKDHEWRYYDPTIASISPCVFLSKVASDPLVQPGETFYYTLSFINASSMALTNIVLTDALPAGLTFVSSVPAQSSGPSPLVWNLGTVETNSVRQVRVYVKATTVGTLLNTVVATRGTNVIGQAQETVEVSYKALLREEKTVSPSTVAPGGTVAYTINVYNEGTGPNGIPLVVREYLPAGFSFVSLQSAQINGAALPLGSVAVNTSNSNAPTFTINQSIQAGKKLVLVFTAAVSASEPSGTYFNEVGLNFENKVVSGAPEAPVTVGGGRIGDYLWRDWDGDGIQDSGEEGLSNVTVRLYIDANNNGLYDAGDTLASTQVTGVDGSYLFTGLLATNYLAVVDTNSLSGYVLTFDPQGVADSQAYTNLAFDQVVLTFDFGYRPAGTGSIGDMVFKDADRNGLYGVGDAGISNVTVRLYEDTNRNGIIDSGDLMVATTNTAFDGSYTFAGLATNLGYIVDVDEADVDFVAQAGATYLTTTPLLATIPNLAGAYSAADFGYFPLVPGSIGDQVFVDNNGDGVYSNATDAPLSSVTVWLYEDRNGNGMYDAGDLLAATAVTDVQGKYNFTNLPAANYIVVVNQADPDLPAGFVPTFGELALSLGVGQSRADIDFPFYPVLKKTVNRAVAALGNTVAYAITPYYPGPGLLADASIFDPIPTGLTYVAASANAGGYLATNLYELTEGVTTSVTEVQWDLGSNSDDIPGVTAGRGQVLAPAPLLLLTNNVDTYIEQGNPTRNFGVTTVLKTRPANATSRKHGLLYFDVASIPSNAIVASAALKLNVTGARKSNHVVELHRMLTAWVEGTGNNAASGDGATWNTRNGVNAWASGAFSTNDYSSTVVSLFKPAATGLASVDVTSLISIWRTNAAANFGLVLLATGTDAGDAQYSSSDAASGKPYLEIRYFLSTNATIQGIATNTVVQDTYVDKQNPTTDQDIGDANTLRSRPDNNTRHVLLSFDVGNIPPGSTISSAQLLAHVTNTRGSSHTDVVHRVKTSWIEGATWNTRDGLHAWASGTFGTNDYDATAIGSIIPDTKVDKVVDVTAVVNDWVNNGVPNRGLVLLSTGIDNGDAQYESREDVPAEAARLIITWTNTVTTQPQTTTELHVRPLLMDDAGHAVVSMTAIADGIISNVVAPADLTVSAPGGVGYSKISGPVPAGPLVMASNTTYTFTYTYDVTPGLNPGAVTFSGHPTATNASFLTAVSEGMIVTPALTYTATVTSVAGLMAVTNTAGFLNYTASALTSLGALIGDYVWADLDGDGVQDANEVPLANMPVSLFDATGTNLLATTMTDAGGLYQFMGLGTNTYQVNVGYSNAPAGYTPSTPIMLTVPITNATQQYLAADFGFQPASTGRVGDTVWLDLNGNGVQDVAETGISNVTVNLYIDMNTNGVLDAGDPLIQALSTATNGYYLFGGLPVNHYLVAVSSNTLPSGVASTTGGGLQLANISSAGQSITTVDFGYNHTGLIGDFVWWDDDRDGIPDVGETPVTSAVVMLYYDANSNGVLEVMNGDYQIAYTVTDTNGTYAFTNLPAGHYLVDVYEDSIGNDGPVPTTAPVRYVNLPSGATNLTADFGYYIGARVEGNVFWDENRNILFDGSEGGLTNVTVYLNGYDMYGSPVTMTNTTDASGHFSFVTPEGDYSLTYSSPSLLANYPVLTDTTTGTNFAFHAYPGESWIHPPFDFGVDNSGRIGDTIFADVNSSGVQNAGEPGLANVTVELYRDNNNNSQVDAGDTFLDVCATDANGNYQFPGLPDGDYVVSVTTATLPAGYQTTPSAKPPTEWVSGSQAGVTISGGNTVLDRDFGYPPVPGITYFAVSGTIWDDGGYGGGTKTNAMKDGTEYGFTNVAVVVRVDTNSDGTNDLVYTVHTDTNGYYSVSGIPSNSTVRIAIQEGTLPSPVYQITPGMTNVLTVSHIAADMPDRNFGYYADFGSISGTIVADADGDGVAEMGETAVGGIPVTLRYAGADGIPGTGDDVLATTITDGSGNYSFTNLPPGQYEITKTNPPGYYSLADADGGNSGSISLTLANGQNIVDRDFELYQLASVGDYTWVDGNRNGRQDAGESALSNVVVTLYDAGYGVVATTTSSVSGAYVFSNLLPGIYAVGFVAPMGYQLTKSDVGDDATDSDAAQGLGVTSPITLVSGQTNNAVDAGFVALGAIGDRVWLDENADGVQDAGESGIANVRVVLSGTNGVALATNVTDSAGLYLFTGLMPGTYVVRVDTNSMVAGLAANQTYDSDAATNNETTVSLAGGQELVTADFGYNWAPASSVGGNTGTGAIGDRIWIDADGDGRQDPGEPGLGGVTVTLVSLGADGIAGTSDDTTNTTMTAADGSYSFDELSAGAYIVILTAGTTGYTQTGDPDGVLDGRTTQPILLAPGDVYVNADFGYQPLEGNGATIGDLVWFDANGDGATNGAEYGIAGVSVALIRDGNTNGMWDVGEPIIATTLTDAGGAYAFHGVPVNDGAGTDDYLVWVNDAWSVLSGLAPTYDSNGVFSPNISSVTDLTAGGNLLQDFGYTAAGQVGNTGHIGDTLFLDRNTNGVYEAGEGMEGVTVGLYDTNGVLLASTTTDENGHYNFAGLSTNDVTYVVKVSTNTLPGTAGQLTNTVDPDGGMANQATVILTGASPVNLSQDFGYADLVTPNLIVGTVWEDRDSSGVLDAGETNRFAAVTVTLYDTNGNVVATTVTDSNGNYAFNGLPDGTYVVDVTDTAGILEGAWHSLGAAGVNNNSQSDPYTVVLSGGQTADADFGYYKDGAALGNRVWFDANKDGIQDPGETGLNNVRVILRIAYPGGTTNVVSLLTDTNGYYGFANLLLDENFDGVAGGEPGYTLSVVMPGAKIGLTVAGATNQWLDSNSNETVAVALKGFISVGLLANPANESTNATYDFGLVWNQTLARLVGFRAFSRGGAVVVSWETSEELDTAGFYLERLAGDQYRSVNDEFIPSYEMGGGVYEQVDPSARAGGCYTYRLIELETSGNRLYLGPYVVTVDGLALSFDEWSRSVFSAKDLFSPAVSGAEADPDGDGMNNLAEFMAGTNPTNKDSALRIRALDRTSASEFSVKWLSESNRVYSVEHAVNLQDGFQPLTNGVRATPPENSILDAIHPDSDTHFYRIRIE